ncbi:MAG: RlmE family RNA methyltransferase [Burkholderiales bacterium]|jgi:23S rRNA (uridine2552-2'-O)-methyltransferase|nr:RlmE family RNA methyltransferase [Burkholderiales bacterium]
MKTRTGLNSGVKKHRFGKAWMHEHVNDPYVKEAQRLGFRARAAFKLIELDERDHLLRPNMTVVDLGAAPGSWCQVVRKRAGAKTKIIAIDILPMEGLNGVHFIQADFSDANELRELEVRFDDAAIDLVLSDLSPNLSGVESADQARSVGLAELALDFCVRHLRTGGDFVVKVFQGTGFADFRRTMGEHFEKTYARKPKASRDRSREIYLVGKRFLGGENRVCR